MLDSETATEAAEALTIAIVALFEEGLDAGVRGAKSLAEYSDRARSLRGLAEDAIVLTAALRTLAQRGDRRA
jgi:hypothetical protein